MSKREVWKWIYINLKPDRAILIIAMICSAGVAGVSLGVVSLLGSFVDSAQSGHARLNDHVDPGSLHKIVIITFEVVVLYAFKWFFTYGQTVLFADAGMRLGLRLRNDIYSHLQGLSLGFFNGQRTGALMSTINNDVPLLQTTVIAMKDVAVAPCLIIGGLWKVLNISIPLTLGAVVVVPAMLGFNHLFSKRIESLTGQTQDKLSDVNTLMEETLSGIRIIQSFGVEDAVVQRFKSENKLSKDLAISVVRQSAKLKPTSDLVGATGVAIAFVAAGTLVLRGHLTIGSLLQFIGGLNLVAIGIGGLGSTKVLWEQIKAGSSRIKTNVLDVNSDIADSPGAIDLVEGQGRVEFRDVFFGYKPGVPVLCGVSFCMEPGKVVAVVGPSGAGKSTLSDLIPRFYDPDGGAILVNGHDVRDVTLKSLRQQIGIVPQETVLFAGSIFENIRFGKPGASMDEVIAAAQAANAHGFISDPSVMPDGYQTIVGERGKQLSGGQRQRIAIARALLKNPRILILDEATSSLDAASEELVQDALDELMQDRTTLVIAHRLSTIVSADNILVMDGGRIIESGPHDELINRPDGVYARLYETQHRREQDTDSRVQPTVPPAGSCSLTGDLAL